MADNDNNNDQVLIMLGEIKGELAGINRLVQATSDSTNKRIDDLATAMNRRIDDHQDDTKARFDAVQKEIGKKSVTAGGASGALVAGVVKLIEVTLGG
ncbi:MAG: hypothetical protein QNK32_09640 [Porticoccus sp.]|nr:hypothetical protein [Porticoccus sp.]